MLEFQVLVHINVHKCMPTIGLLLAYWLLVDRYSHLLHQLIATCFSLAIIIANILPYPKYQ